MEIIPPISTLPAVKLNKSFFLKIILSAVPSLPHPLVQCSSTFTEPLEPPHPPFVSLRTPSPNCGFLSWFCCLINRLLSCWEWFTTLSEGKPYGYEFHPQHYIVRMMPSSALCIPSSKSHINHIRGGGSVCVRASVSKSLLLGVGASGILRDKTLKMSNTCLLLTFVSWKRCFLIYCKRLTYLWLHQPSWTQSISSNASLSYGTCVKCSNNLTCLPNMVL